MSRQVHHERITPVIQKAFTFRGGVHPKYHKESTSSSPSRKMDLPAKLGVSMAHHLGAPAKPLVAPGDEIKTGQLIGEAVGLISAPVHSPVCGKVIAVEPLPTILGRMVPAVLIEPQKSDEEIAMPVLGADADPVVLLARIGEAGVVGMGGAGFPTRVKLSPPKDKPIDTLIINGAECEPWLTSDHRAMIEDPDGICMGVEIIRRILGVKTVRVAIEDNKPDAIAAMEKAISRLGGDVGVTVLHTLYPQGGEKQQIYAVTKREMPRGGLPMDVGCVVENVSTSLAIFEAVAKGRPLTHRRITVTGDAVNAPANLIAPIGTFYHDLIEACSGTKGHVGKIIAGGPMMGFAVADRGITMSKTASGLLVLSDSPEYRSMACISCGRCIDACPLRLMPSEISQCVEADDIDGAEQAHVTDCCECGCCAFACPARRPLVQHIRRAKALILAKRAAQKK